MEDQVKEVVYNMLIARKYNIENKDEFMKTNESYITHKIGKKDDKMIVFFSHKNNKVGVLAIRQYVEEMKKNLAERSIIVVKEEITAFAKQIFVEEKHLSIEYFKENELYIDKTKHVLVPKHELLDEEEKTELLKIYNIKELNLPKILSSDPISKYYGAKRGQVFKITRNSESCGETVYYRVVI